MRVAAANKRFVAFMDDPDEDKPNPIHSTDTAREHGFRGALIGGATAYGWTVETIVAALGEGWLDDGWTELKFRAPMYPDDELDISVDDTGCLQVERGAELCFGGHVGLGRASWLDELVTPATSDPMPGASALPLLTLANAPVGSDLAARSVSVDVSDALAFNVVRQREGLPAFSSNSPRIHPAWIAEQLIHLLHHSYDYGPSIHTASRIQHLAAAYAPQRFVVSGHCVEAYERKGHHYVVNDGAIANEAGELIARLRHTAIFRIDVAR